MLKEGFFRRTVAELAGRPSEAKDLLTGLFLTFRKGGRFGLDRLPWINGGLFDDREALPLDDHEIGLLKAASSQDWAHIDPTIFGTLFERFLDPDKRSQIGAHYTDAGKIGQIIEPVILRPLREEWQAARFDIEKLVKKASSKGAKSKDWQRAEERRSAFMERLRTLSILDPACGSGNFLYLALHGVKDLEHAANQECESMGLPPRLPVVGPEILHGIEINPLAAELARTTVWIGDIQWAIQNGIRSRPEPILRRLDSIECRDALLNSAYQVADWPKAEMIIGNPPFLGTKKMLSGLGASYTKALRSAYKGQISSFSDIVCWWFYKGLEELEEGHTQRIGLVATNSIRGGKNREVLDMITTKANIYEAWSDEPWLLDGASVRVSLICYSKDTPNPIFLDGKPVSCINSDLTEGEGHSTSDLTQAKGLRENDGVAFNGIVKGGKFEVPGRIARSWVQQPLNANKKSNLQVVRPWKSGDDVTSHDRDLWLIDFGSMSEDEACYYETPFKWVCDHVKDYRCALPEKREKHYWWQLSRPGTAMKASLLGKPSYIAIPEVSKHQMAVMMPNGSIPDKNLVVMGVDDYSLFGILTSKFHRSWARRLGTSLEDRPRYTSSTTFRTFPFPESFFQGTVKMPLGPNTQGYNINNVAQRLHTDRQNWLYPSDTFAWVPDVDESLPDRAIFRKGKSISDVKKRTVTELYNEQPAWIMKVHAELDRAVAAAYGWPEDISTEDALAALLDLNRERAAAQGKA